MTTCCAPRPAALQHYRTRFMFRSVAEQRATTFGTEVRRSPVTTACRLGASAQSSSGSKRLRRGGPTPALCAGTDGT